MAGEKPELKISVKPSSGEGGRVSLFAFWRNDRGYLNGRLDNRIRGVRVFLEDGGYVDVKRVDGKHSHFIDAFEERPAQSHQRSAPAGDFPPDDGGADWGSDDVPFLERDGRLP